MPRRKRQLLKRAEADVSEAEVHRRDVREAVRTRNVLGRLRDEVQDRLVDDLVDAIGYAKAGLADILSGKRVKPRAWMLDIFVKDVSDAMERAGILAVMDPDPEASHAQSLAMQLIRIAGLPEGGKLFKQMQRAKEILKTRLPDVYITDAGIWFRRPVG
jgi:hypothetical protein